MKYIIDSSLTKSDKYYDKGYDGQITIRRLPYTVI